jgi:hypothetical protein
MLAAMTRAILRRRFTCPSTSRALHPIDAPGRTVIAYRQAPFDWLDAPTIP